MKKNTVYLESSVISYYANEISADLKVAAEQRITHEWWSKVLPKLDAHISPFVIQEIERGRSAEAQARLDAVRGLKILSVTDSIDELAAVYIRKLALPIDDHVDAFHLAVAAVYELDFLVSWNCKHIANAFKFPLIRKINESMGYLIPTICTPRELMEVSNG